MPGFFEVRDEVALTIQNFALYTQPRCMSIRSIKELSYFSMIDDGGCE